MLSLKILNTAAALNNFSAVGSVQFVPGSQVRVVVQVFQPERPDSLRYVVEDPAGTLSLVLDRKDGTELTVALTAFPSDRSMWSTTLTPAQTQDLSGGNVRFVLDLTGAGTQLELGYVDNALQRVNTGGC